MDHLRNVGRFFAAVVIALFVIGFLGAWSSMLGFMLAVFGVPTLAIILLAVGLVFSVRGAKLARAADGPMRERLLIGLSAPTGLVLAILCALPVLWTGKFAGTGSRLAVNHSRYEAIISAARKQERNGEHSAFLTDRGVTYMIDFGPPVRVAFNPEGFLDNWSGIIFDPTGDVMLADGFNPVTGKFYAPERVTKLFGGDLVSCRRLWRDYYACSFT